MSAIILNIPTAANSSGYKDERAALAYNNILSASDIYVSLHADEAGFLVDGMTTTSWSSGSGSHIIRPSTNGASINCIALSPSNFGNSATSIKLEIETAFDTEVIFDGSGFKDNDPIMFVFDERVPTQVTLTITTTSELYLTGLYAGKAMVFPCGVSVGYQPARWSTDDQINVFRTESNAFGQATVFSRGSTESFSVENINQDFMNSTWIDFIDNSKGQQVWFSWDYLEDPRQVMYGSYTTNKPAYDSSTFSSVNITIQGLTS